MNNTTSLHLLRRPLAALLTALASPSAMAVDANWSGFATIGFASSNSDYTYQGSIDRNGTFRRDSLVAGQLDLKLSPQWSATTQIKLGPADNSDTRWTARAAWAFVAWRPDNDWLVRAGKTRLPLYLYSESLDLGVANDMARLPHEMYSVSPTNDFTGLFVTRNFNWGERDVSVEGYHGRADATARYWSRDGVPPHVPAGSGFRTVNVQVSGLVFTARDSRLTGRLGLLSVRTKSVDGRALPVTFPRVEIAPGLGYWRVDDAMPGPPIDRVDMIRNWALTSGAEWSIGDGWRLTGEYVRMHQHDTELGSDSRAGYLALFKRIGAFTPYVSLARQRSSDGLLDLRAGLISQGLPTFLPGAAQINAAQRLAGETGYAFDQRSTALGLSYALSSTAKIKAEWMRTTVGKLSTHFDVPPGKANTQGLKVNTLTVNVSVAF